MARNIIDLPTLGDDGRLYRDTALDLVESLIPNPWESCHAPDLLELENGDLLCCWFAGSREETPTSALRWPACLPTPNSGSSRSLSRMTRPAVSRTHHCSKTPTVTFG